MNSQIAIPSFRGQFSFLSNFFIEPDGTHVEGEYQANKVVPYDPKIAVMPPKQAKAVGNSITKSGKLRPDWHQVNLGIMYSLVKQKFLDHRELELRLLGTLALTPNLIEEGNNWGDMFHGVVDGIGHNHLGRTLMRVRLELLKGQRNNPILL